MNHLYSLNDAPVSIAVPSDRARAVVDAMERDMPTALATRQDLAGLRIHADAQYALLRREIEALRVSVTRDIQGLRVEFEAMSALTARDLDALRASMTIRLGSMRVVGLGLLFAALKLT